VFSQVLPATNDRPLHFSAVFVKKSDVFVAAHIIQLEKISCQRAKKQQEMRLQRKPGTRASPPK